MAHSSRGNPRQAILTGAQPLLYLKVCGNVCSEDLYVGAFLRKEAVEAGAEDQPVEASSLQEVGTFAHVHTIHQASGSAHGGGAMVLLVGHRRIRQLKTVGTHHQHDLALALQVHAQILLVGIERENVLQASSNSPHTGQDLLRRISYVF